MDLLALVRAVGGLATVLGLLVGATWLARRYKLAWPGIATGRREARLLVVERLAVDQRRSLLLIRRDGREHLLLIGPEAPLLIEAGIKPATPAACRTAPPPSFAAMLKTARRPAANGARRRAAHA